MKIRGNTVGTTMPRTDWDQTNPKKASYLKGRDKIIELINKAQNSANNAQTTANEKAVTKTFKGTLLASGWSSKAPFTQTVTINGLLSTDYPFVDIDLSEVSNAQSVIEGWNMVGRVTVDRNNTIIGYCYEEKPTVDIPVVFKVVR